MKSEHRTFIIQLFVCAVVLITAISGTNLVFSKAESSVELMAANDEITNLRKSSSEIINNLIKGDSLTFDPSNGVSIEKVFRNLKTTTKRKILLLGSSQLVTVSNDMSFDKHKRRVDLLLQEMYNGEVIVYNLSLGGMTVDEKEIMLNKIQEIYHFDAIVVSIGPYDCRENNVRLPLENLKTKQFKSRKDTISPISTEKNSSDKSLNILTLNKSISNHLTEMLEDNFKFYKNRTAIKTWLANGITDGFKSFKKNNENEEVGIGEPVGWKTYLNELNVKTGWVNRKDTIDSKALKIVNTKKTNANWKGEKVLLEKPTKTLLFGVSSKSENVQGAKLYCLDVKVEFDDGTYQWYYKGLTFKQGTNQWSSIKKKVTFDKNVKAVTPTLILYGVTGIAWFDDIYIKPVYQGIISGNILINGEIEQEIKMQTKKVHSLKFDESVWNSIYKNSASLATFFGKNTPENTKKYLLIPPVYTSLKTSGYKQQKNVDKFKVNLKSICKDNNIKLLDASEILNENYFTPYSKGKRKGEIEPLHFNSNGHLKLAKFLFDELIN